MNDGFSLVLCEVPGQTPELQEILLAGKSMSAWVKPSKWLLQYLDIEAYELTTWIMNTIDYLYSDTGLSSILTIGGMEYFGIGGLDEEFWQEPDTDFIVKLDECHHSATRSGWTHEIGRMRYERSD
jgi:hypothetical protein